ncbi:hypothetical protein RA307_01220 [Xanthobacteraceae bacterium Astr-EGSB]|uniref:hypothetical protein n=1 Tax=Astrobacterium formosum TaxID=3069710 RepID=UPI0027ADEFED|nr:hypothetical protein [Xanthobacteraceae bacterium Astr-EGSB]
MAARRTVKVGEWVEVRPLTDIMKTLDDNCAFDGMPFLPEMVRYVGHRFQIVKSAHKTCDPTGASDLRRIPDAVHLETRCDGSAHGGCEARCLLFWKNAWLKPVDGPQVDDKPPLSPQDDDLEKLEAATRYTTDFGEVRYRCQATEVVAASNKLPVSDMRQYVEDVSTGNVQGSQLLIEMVRLYANAAIGKALRSVGIGGARVDVAKPAGAPTRQPATLDLQPGELVQIRPAEEILATLDERLKNRGLTLELEMLRHCGRIYRVLARVTRLIDEKSGKMINLTSDCVILDGVSCRGLDNRQRAFCPRGALFYWREAWLKRAGIPDGSGKS